MAVESETEAISKDDLPAEVVDYINTLEETVTLQDGTIELADAANADLVAKLAKAEAAVKPIEKSDPESEFNALIAKADPELRTVLSKQRDELREAQAEIKKEREEREHRDFISKADYLPHIGGTSEEVAEILHAVHKADPEVAEKLETLLTAANEQIEKSGLFEEVGVAGGDTTVSKSVEARVTELRKSDPTLTSEQAEAKVYEENPDLYTQINQERG